MTKRSAMLVAAGIVMALVAGGIGMSLGQIGPASAAATTTETTPKHQRPIVRRHVRTITIHKKAKSPAPAPQQIVVPAPAVSYSAPSTAPAPGSGSYHENSSPDNSPGGGGDD